MQCRVFYEILRMHSPLKEWLKHHNKTLGWVRNRLLEEMDTYVLAKDPSLQKLVMSRGGIPYERQACSLIISYGHVPAESPRIELAYPLYQGLLHLAPGPAPHVFPVQNDLKMNISKLEVEDFVDLICRRVLSPITDEASADMVRAIRSSPGATRLVEQYGWLFATVDTKRRAHREATERMPGQGGPLCGYVGFPGSVIHGGPPCDTFQLALSAAYGQASDEPYDPESRITASALHAMLSDLILDGMMMSPAPMSTFLQVGRQLLFEVQDGLSDFFQYGDHWSTWNPENVSGGLLMATAQARFFEKTQEEFEIAHGLR
jgi:hypothetical protein